MIHSARSTNIYKVVKNCQTPGEKGFESVCNYVVNEMSPMMCKAVSCRWCCDLVVDTWLQDQNVPCSSPGCAMSTFEFSRKVLYFISPPHSCVQRVPYFRQYARVRGHL